MCVILPHLYTSGEKRQAATDTVGYFWSPGKYCHRCHPSGTGQVHLASLKQPPECCSVVALQEFSFFFFFFLLLFFSPKATGSGGGAGETNQGDYRTEGGQRQEVAPEGELDETEGDLYTRAVFEQTELRSGSEKRD